MGYTREEIYSDACRMMEKYGLQDLEDAVLLFEQLKGYKDSKEKISECKERIQRIKLEEERKKGLVKKLIILAAAIVVLFVIALKIDLWHYVFPVFKSETEMVTYLERNNWEIIDDSYGIRQVKFFNGEMHTYYKNGHQTASNYRIKSYRSGSFTSVFKYVANPKDSTVFSTENGDVLTKTDNSDLIDNALSVEETERINKEDVARYQKALDNARGQGSSSGGNVTDDDKLLCWMVAKEYVSSQLKSPSSAKFPSSYTSSDISYSRSGSYYTVSSYVDADNSYGANIRQKFTVKIEIIGDKNRVVSCDFE